MTFYVRKLHKTPQPICPTYFLCLPHSLSLQVMKAVADQYRLPAPHNCPPALHSLMLQCWQADRGDRPAFDTLLSSLDRLIRHPASLKAEPTRWDSRKHITGSRKIQSVFDMDSHALIFDTHPLTGAALSHCSAPPLQTYLQWQQSVIGWRRWGWRDTRMSLIRRTWTR